MADTCMKANCENDAERTVENDKPLMYCKAHRPDLTFPGHGIIPVQPTKSCGGDNPWRERLKCAGFCIAAHIAYEAFVHFVLPLVL